MFDVLPNPILERLRVRAGARSIGSPGCVVRLIPARKRTLGRALNTKHPPVEPTSALYIPPRFDRLD